MAAAPKKPSSLLLNRDKAKPGNLGYRPINLPKYKQGDRVGGREVPVEPPPWKRGGMQDSHGRPVPPSNAAKTAREMIDNGHYQY